MSGGYAAFFASVFQSYCILASAFFNSPMPFWVDVTNICISFVVYYVHFIKKTKCFGQKDFVMNN